MGCGPLAMGVASHADLCGACDQRWFIALGGTLFALRAYHQVRDHLRMPDSLIGKAARKLDPSHLIWVGMIGAVCSVLILAAGVIWQTRQGERAVSIPVSDPAKTELESTRRQLAETQEALRKAQDPQAAKPQPAPPTSSPKPPPRPPLPDPRKYYDAETKQALGKALKIMRVRLEEVEPALAPIISWERPNQRGAFRGDPGAIYAKLQAALEAVGRVAGMPSDEDYKEIAPELAYVVNIEKLRPPWETMLDANRKVSVFYSLGRFDTRSTQSPDLTKETLAEAINKTVAPVGAAAGELRDWAVQTREHIEDMRRALSL